MIWEVIIIFFIYLLYFGGGSMNELETYKIILNYIFLFLDIFINDCN